MQIIVMIVETMPRIKNAITSVIIITATSTNLDCMACRFSVISRFLLKTWSTS